MLVLLIALLAGISAAFTGWLCCVAVSDYLLSYRFRHSFGPAAALDDERSASPGVL